jgi:hypothetical protein
MEVSMPLYSVKTDMSTDEAIKTAVEYFGEGGVGLELINQDACCADFEGGGGHISVRVVSGEKTEVNLETREWDYPVKQFMRRIS